MRLDLTDITIILDRSGSMGVIAHETEMGVKKFVDDQKAVPGHAVMSLVLFDHQIERPFTAKPISEVGEIRLQPRAATALLDAVGSTIKATGERLGLMAEKDRPSRVIIVIVTDGLENASRTYDKDQVLSMISHQTDVYKWDFVFLGANQDAIATAASIGVQANAALTYAASAGGVKGAYAAVSSVVATSRRGGQAVCHVGFSDEQRKSAKQ